MENRELTLEQVLAELNPAEQEAAREDYAAGMSPQEIKEFFDSL